MPDVDGSEGVQTRRRERGDTAILGGFISIFISVVVAWVLCCTMYGIPLGAPGAPASGPQSGGSAAPVPGNMYLTIQINPVTGWPQYTPANFTVPTGEVYFTITNYDVPANFTGCQCNVTGTVGNVENVNGTAYSLVNNSNVAHTFDIPTLGVNVLSPGMSTVTFELDLTQPGTYTWLCEMPCGADGMTGPPMGIPGYMTGTMTVV